MDICTCGTCEAARVAAKAFGASVTIPSLEKENASLLTLNGHVAKENAQLRAELEQVKTHHRYDLEQFRKCADKLARMEVALALVKEQAIDEGLWFIAQYASESYLQAALRKLHAIIEDEVLDGK